MVLREVINIYKFCMELFFLFVLKNIIMVDQCISYVCYNFSTCMYINKQNYRREDFIGFNYLQKT